MCVLQSFRQTTKVVAKFKTNLFKLKKLCMYIKETHERLEAIKDKSGNRNFKMRIFKFHEMDLS